MFLFPLALHHTQHGPPGRQTDRQTEQLQMMLIEVITWKTIAVIFLSWKRHKNVKIKLFFLSSNCLKMFGKDPKAMLAISKCKNAWGLCWSD